MTPLRFISRTGTVHEPSGRTERGYQLTMCGLSAESGWCTRPMVPVRDVGCVRCIRAIRLAERPKTRRKGQPVGMDWSSERVVAIVAMGRDQDPMEVVA